MEGYSLKRSESMKRRRRVGCGPSSGSGKTCGRGQDGQRSRSGSTRRPWFEGGQMPLQRRVPKRGFNNIFMKQYQLVNVGQLEGIDVAELTPEVLKKKGLIKKSENLIKILGEGEITKSIKISADAFSKSAEEKIKKAGGAIMVRQLEEKKKEV